MKIDVLHITDAELVIMELLWEMGRPLTTAEIGLLRPDRGWKQTTINTLAMQLVNKGFVQYYQSGGKNYYLPYIMELDYKFVVSKAFVEKLHDGSIVELVRTLLCDWEISAEELDNLRALVDTAVLPSMACETDEGVADLVDACDYAEGVGTEDICFDTEGIGVENIYIDVESVSMKDKSDHMGDCKEDLFAWRIVYVSTGGICVENKPVILFPLARDSDRNVALYHDSEANQSRG